MPGVVVTAKGWLMLGQHLFQAPANIYLGNPNDAGIGTTDIGTSAFAIWQNTGGSYTNVSRTFTLSI